MPTDPTLGIIVILAVLFALTIAPSLISFGYYAFWWLDRRNHARFVRDARRLLKAPASASIPIAFQQNDQKPVWSTRATSGPDFSHISYAMTRTETVCARCHADQGLFFPDGAPPPDERYGIAPAALAFAQGDDRLPGLRSSPAELALLAPSA